MIHLSSKNGLASRTFITFDLFAGQEPRIASILKLHCAIAPPKFHRPIMPEPCSSKANDTLLDWMYNTGRLL